MTTVTVVSMAEHIAKDLGYLNISTLMRECSIGYDQAMEIIVLAQKAGIIETKWEHPGFKYIGGPLAKFMEEMDKENE